MKLVYRTNIYEGPETREGILKLSKKLIRAGWQTKIYDSEKLLSYGPPRGETSGEIWGLSWTAPDGTKVFSRNLGTIELGRIETHDRDKNLERFLRDYNSTSERGKE